MHLLARSYNLKDKRKFTASRETRKEPTDGRGDPRPLDQEAHEQCVVVGCREHQGIKPQRSPCPGSLPRGPQLQLLLSLFHSSIIYLRTKRLRLLGETQRGESSFPQLSCCVPPGAPQATCLTPEQGIAGEICKNYSAVITAQLQSREYEVKAHDLQGSFTGSRS